MPTYQYACTDCGHRFEQVQAFTDPSLTECPNCGGKLRKVYGSVGVVFKGTGFYRTDARNGANGKPAAVDGKAEKSEKVSAAASSEAGGSKSSDASSSSGSTAAASAGSASSSSSGSAATSRSGATSSTKSAASAG